MKEDKTPLISVIVPVYNVEPYLKKCVDSLLKQTYKNLEIILVDDGSPDKCGKICDEYAKKDARIAVIHKENGGLSEARNFGIDKAKGDYLSFVDSDDFVSPYFIEILYKGICLNQSDICTVDKGIHFTDGGEEEVEFARNSKDFTASPILVKEALRLMMLQKLPNGAQWRLYKRNIFESIRFPVGYLFEDVATIHKTFMNAEKMVCVKARIYAYRVRKNGIVRMPFSERKLICLTIAEQLVDEMEAYDASLVPAAKSRAFAMNYQVFLQIPFWDRKSQKKVWEKIRKYRRDVICLKDSEVRIKNKAGALCSYLGMSISHIAGRMYKTISEKKNYAAGNENSIEEKYKIV